MSIFIGTDQVGINRISQAQVNREVLILNSKSNVPMVQMYSPCNENMFLLADTEQSNQIFFGKANDFFQVRHRRTLNRYMTTFEINQRSNTVYVDQILSGSNNYVRSNLYVNNLYGNTSRCSNLTIDVPDRNTRNAFLIQYVDNPLFMVNNNGYCGINLSAPQAHLHVNSNIMCTHTMTAPYMVANTISALTNNLAINSAYIQLNGLQIDLNANVTFKQRIAFDEIGLRSNLEMPTMNVNNNGNNLRPSVNIFYAPSGANMNTAHIYNGQNHLLTTRTVMSNALPNGDVRLDDYYALSVDSIGRTSLGIKDTNSLLEVRPMSINCNLVDAYMSVRNINGDPIVTIDSNQRTHIGPLQRNVLAQSNSQFIIQDNQSCATLMHVMRSNDVPFAQYGRWVTTHSINLLDGNEIVTQAPELLSQMGPSGSLQLGGYFALSNQYALAVRGPSFQDTVQTSNLVGVGVGRPTISLQQSSIRNGYLLESCNVQASNLVAESIVMTQHQAQRVIVTDRMACRTDGIMPSSNVALEGKVHISVDEKDNSMKLGRGIVVTGQITEDTSALIQSLSRNAMLEVQCQTNPNIYGLFGIDQGGNLFLKHRRFPLNNTNASDSTDVNYITCTKPLENSPSRMTIYNTIQVSNNNVGIGTVPSSIYKLHISGGDIFCENDIIALSDAAVKTNIRPIESALDMVTQMRGVRYEKTSGTRAENLGVIAQEIEKICPEIVKQPQSDGAYKGVAYMQIIPILIEAIKELKAQVEALS